MGNKDTSRSGVQTAADLARAARAIHNIARAATAAGLHGAAVAAAKETLPFLIKLAAAVIAAVLLVPLVVFIALPNVFFGFDTASDEALVQLSSQALVIGDVYMSLEEFERRQTDVIVSALIAQYEESGTKIDEVKLTSDLREADLLWIIAIHSVQQRQDLNAMSEVNIQNFCSSHLPVTSVLEESGGKNILKVHMEQVDPDSVMESLGFADDARNWSGALFETMEESGALKLYEDRFVTEAPSYNGDGAFSGGVQYGGGQSNEIDVSGFVSPRTKNNLDLVNYAMQAYENQWGYVWGTFGHVLTESQLENKVAQYPDGVGGYEDFIRDNWVGRRTADCCGLIKGYGWFNPANQTFGYAENGMPDITADQMYRAGKAAGTEGEDYGTMDSMPDIPGLALWKEGHIGVYIGNGEAVEAMGTRSGVVKTAVQGRGWAGWCKIPYITYLEAE